MKEETNKEMDLLLRRLSRRQDGYMPDADTRNAGEHLDADELSSYAENVLPVAARARYTEHLAECSRCRELVVQLSASAGIVVAEHTSRTPAPSGLRNFLASLFSPMVLRYAVPALGLVVVAAIGLLFFYREQPMNREVAVTQKETPLDTFYDQAKPSPASAAEGRTKTSEKKENAAPPPNAPPAVSINADVKKEAPGTKAEEQPAENAAAAPPPKPQPSVVDDFRVEAEARRQATEPQSGGASKLVKEKPSEQTRVDDRRTDVDTARSGSTRGRTPSTAVATGASAGQANSRYGTEEKDKSDAETRSFAGHRFRKERGIWIDTSYQAGTGTINMTRGSEQYRVLVSDEPMIKTIADQLPGEFIVVWKGRAYRIR
jgi:hypothetical protein